MTAPSTTTNAANWGGGVTLFAVKVLSAARTCAAFLFCCFKGCAWAFDANKRFMFLPVIIQFNLFRVLWCVHVFFKSNGTIFWANGVVQVGAATGPSVANGGCAWQTM